MLRTCFLPGHISLGIQKGFKPILVLTQRENFYNKVFGKRKRDNVKYLIKNAKKISLNSNAKKRSRT